MPWRLLLVMDLVCSAAAASLHMSFDGGGEELPANSVAADASVKSRRSVIDKSVEDYLTQFGYLPQSDLETGALRTLRQLEDAVRSRVSTVAVKQPASNAFLVLSLGGGAMCVCLHHHHQQVVYPRIYTVTAPVMIVTVCLGHMA